MVRCIDCGFCGYYIDLLDGLRWREMDTGNRSAFERGAEHNPNGQNPGTGHWQYVRCNKYLHEWRRWADVSPAWDELSGSLTVQRDCKGYIQHLPSLTPVQHYAHESSPVVEKGQSERPDRLEAPPVIHPQTKPGTLSEVLREFHSDIYAPDGLLSPLKLSIEHGSLVCTNSANNPICMVPADRVKDAIFEDLGAGQTFVKFLDEHGNELTRVHASAEWARGALAWVKRRFSFSGL